MQWHIRLFIFSCFSLSVLAACTPASIERGVANVSNQEQQAIGLAAQGLVWYRQGRLLEAEAALRQSAEILPSQTTQQNLAFVLFAMGRYSETQAILDDLGPNLTSLDLQLRLWQAQGQLTTAITKLEQLLSSGLPIRPEWVVSLSRLYFQQGDLEQALCWSRRAGDKYYQQMLNWLEWKHESA